MNDASYKDWGWQSAAFGSAHVHLLPSLLAMLGRPRGPVLDVGCGNGAIARALIAQGYDVYGVDASESGVAIANAQVPDHFFVLDVTSGALPAALAGRRFDVVISTEVIEHLYDPRSFIDFARRHLAGDGEFILSTPYHGYLKNLVMALTGKLDDHFNVLIVDLHPL